MTGVVKAERSHQSAAATRRRLLLLAPFSPRLDAPHGGARAIAQLVSRLADRHDVALLCVPADDDPPVDDVLRGRCQLVEEFVRRGVGRTWKERWSRRARLLTALAKGHPMWVAGSHVVDCAGRPDAIRAWVGGVAGDGCAPSGDDARHSMA
jgi:hypothetical protein